MVSDVTDEKDASVVPRTVRGVAMEALDEMIGVCVSMRDIENDAT